MIEVEQQVTPTPKRLVLSLLSVPEFEVISVRDCTRWGALFGIDAATMRVALGRLVQADLLSSLSRGVYRMGSRGESLSIAAPRWRYAQERLEPWTGDWLLVHTSHLGRSNRSALRGRERALRLEGMQPVQSGLWCRPANYREPLLDTRARMLTLGLETDALVVRAAQMVGTDPARMQALWPRDQLEAGYRDFAQAMADSSARLPAMGLEDAARETFVLGETVIRLINADPLLPSEYIDINARHKLIAGMITYNEAGRAIWQRFKKQ